MRSCSFVVVAACFFSCDPPPDEPSGCEPACATQTPACNDGCPAIADELCVDGACEAVADGVVDVAIDVNIGRDLEGVVALAIAIIDARDSACGDVGEVAAAANVLAGNRIEVSGGTFHPDLRVGLVPEGDVVVAVDALDAEANVVESGCEALTLAGTTGEVLVNVPAI